MGGWTFEYIEGLTAPLHARNADICARLTEDLTATERSRVERDFEVMLNFTRRLQLVADARTDPRVLLTPAVGEHLPQTPSFYVLRVGPWRADFEVHEATRLIRALRISEDPENRTASSGVMSRVIN